jgi:hypothetical protein
MDFGLTVLRACFIPIMELERKSAFPTKLYIIDSI